MFNELFSVFSLVYLCILHARVDDFNINELKFTDVVEKAALQMYELRKKNKHFEKYCPVCLFSVIVDGSLKSFLIRS